MMMDRCSGEYAQDIAESLRFQEEIRSLMRLEPPGPESGSSFTALLGLPPNQAMELLHHEPPGPPEPAAATATATGGNNDVPHAVIIPSSVATVNFPFGCSPTFPCNAALVERAARYSVFASPTEEGSPESSTVPSNSDGNNNNNNHSDSDKVKSEPADSDSNNAASSFATDKPPPPPTPAAAGQQRSGKRKELEKSKAKSGGGKKTKGGAGAGGEDGGVKGADGEKLPYVHVRARRGQATDSHSLAERARREKINARMKLLQELVPGCSKISGTALVLDEIINHVQSLQRQVEFLSMRLAAVNPRIDFSGLDSFLAAENARLTGGNGVGAAGLEAPLWGEVPIDGVRRHHHQQQIWQPDLVPPQQSSSLWERDDNHHSHPHQNYGFINPGPSLFGCDSANPVPLHANQLKTEL